MIKANRIPPLGAVHVVPIYGSIAAQCDAVMLVDCSCQVRKGEYLSKSIPVSVGFIHERWKKRILRLACNHCLRALAAALYAWYHTVSSNKRFVIEMQLLYCDRRQFMLFAALGQGIIV